MEVKFLFFNSKKINPLHFKMHISFKSKDIV